MFKLDVDVGKHRVEATIGKFVDLDVLTESERALRDGVTSILRGHESFDMLVCFESVGPASRQASIKMEDIFTQFLSDRMRKCAHVGVDTIGVMQLRRVTREDPRFQFFDSRADALAWLEA